MLMMQNFTNDRLFNWLLSFLGSLYGLLEQGGLLCPSLTEQ